MKKKISGLPVILTMLVCLASLPAAGQREYPRQYFRNPLDIPILLAGNFGEVRPNHFHSGIDIKTKGKENLPVYAAAAGYVSRIKMEKGGFGHALYVTHPNGYTTLYAHLNDFAPPLQRYLKKVQYEKESWAVDISLSPEQFPVKKGQMIAWSGNTGGSTAPHLHFEIRDTKTEHPLNPQLFGFSIPDTRPPVPTSLALYDMSRSIFMQEPVIRKLSRSGDSYVLTDTLAFSAARLGIGLEVNDFMNGSDNTLNFYTASWYRDGTLEGSILLDDIGYDVTRYLHAYVDYPIRKTKGNWFQLLFRQPGNMLYHLYPQLNADLGAIDLGAGEPHEIKIVLQDASGNETTIRFQAKYAAVGTVASCAEAFVWNRENGTEHPNISFSLKEGTLYDNFCFTLTEAEGKEGAYSKQYSVANASVPAHHYFDLRLKPNRLVPFNLRDKIVMVYSDGKSTDAKAARFVDGWYLTAVRNFGTYWLTADTTAPVISPLQAQGANLSRAKALSFSVTENLTSVKTFRATLNGKWLCFEPKGNKFIYVFDEHCPRGKHRLEVKVADENNNERQLIYTFTR